MIPTHILHKCAYDHICDSTEWPCFNTNDSPCRPTEMAILIAQHHQAQVSGWRWYWACFGCHAFNQEGRVSARNRRKCYSICLMTLVICVKEGTHSWHHAIWLCLTCIHVEVHICSPEQRNTVLNLFNVGEQLIISTLQRQNMPNKGYPLTSVSQLGASAHSLPLAPFTVLSVVSVVLTVKRCSLCNRACKE